jgi:hypothetical protein
MLALMAVACDRTAPPPEPSVEPISFVSEEEKAAGPPHARWEMVEELRADLATERHPSDGGGRAWLEAGGDAVVSQPGSWTLVYEAGPLGITEGGVLGLQVSPFWGWSTPQVQRAGAPGYTEVEHAGPGPARGLVLEADTLGDQLLGIRVRGRALEGGERVRIRYGAGEAGAIADRYAEEASRLWITVDGDGDGARGLVEDSPSLRVAPGEAAGLILTLPSTMAPGEEGELRIAALDRVGNAGPRIEGEIELVQLPEGLELAERVRIDGGDRGRVSLRFRAPEPGLFIVQARGPEGLLGRSNPLLVSEQLPGVLWGDLHGHTALSDGTGTPDAYYDYARWVAGLDFAAITDHDHWGMRFLDQRPDLWEEILAAARAHHDPGHFVTVPGYEWTSWIHGHRHVLFFGDYAQVHSSMDPATEHPQGLWRALAGKQAITVAHHSGGGPVPTDWSIPPDPSLEPIVEVLSVHGGSEAPDAPGSIYDPVAGTFVRDALARGFPLGFIGGGDSHDGHPGLVHLAAGRGGLMAAVDASRDRAGLLEALRSRRVYATNGVRTLLFTTLDGAPMGSSVEPSERASLVLFAVGDGPLRRVEVIRSGRLVESIPAEAEPLVQATIELEGLEDGEYLYLRVVQSNGGLALSSPFFVRPSTGDPAGSARTE